MDNKPTPQLYEHAINASNLGFFVIDTSYDHFPIVFANPAFSDILKLDRNVFLNRSFETSMQPLESATVSRMLSSLQNQQSATIEFNQPSKLSTPTWFEMQLSPVAGKQQFIGLIEDVSHRHYTRDQLVKRSTHDELTQLPNRSLLHDRIQQAIKYSKIHHHQFAVLFIDLDHFKIINDNLGHDVGDALLKALSKRMMLHIRDYDTVARLGGDEFVILLTNLEDEKKAIYITKRLLSALYRPFFIKQHELTVTASIGLSFYPNDGDSADVLVKNADLSMYYAKNSGRNTFFRYHKNLINRVQNHLQLEAGLHRAISKNELDVYYQPIYSLADNRMIAVEALLRWHNPILGSIKPLEFIPVAEESGLILAISEWMMDKTFKQMKQWHKQLPDLKLSLNLSCKQLSDENIIDVFHQILANNQFPSDKLILELTEDLLFSNIQKNKAILDRLHDSQIQFSLDNFGAGFSSLTYLDNFPIHRIKLDLEYAKQLTTDKRNYHIVSSLVKLAHRLKLKVVAKGIESQRQLNTIHQLACDEAQGFFLGEPMPAEQLNKHFQSN